jgi:hypothetical protein
MALTSKICDQETERAPSDELSDLLPWNVDLGETE